MLLETSTQALVSANLESLLENLIIKTTDVFDSDASALFRLNSERTEFTVFATEGWFQEDRIVKINGHESLPAEYDTHRWVLTHDQPLIIYNADTDARYKHLQNMFPFRSILSAPIKIKGRSIGVLETAHLLPNFYREEQLELLMSIANLAAIAIDNANYSERQSQLLKQIISAQEEERKRVARELHDETGQALTALMINLDLIEAKLPSSVTGVTEHLQHSRNVVEQMKGEIHELIYDLRPSILDNLGLLPAVRSHARSVLEKMNIEVDWHVIGEDKRLSAEKEICLFRIIQEAFSNIAKHAEASVVTVQIERQQDIIRVIIEDDGVGFDVDKVLNPTYQDSGFGIRGMEERVRLLRGNFSVDSQTGFGTQLLIEIPIDAEEES